MLIMKTDLAYDEYKDYEVFRRIVIGDGRYEYIHRFYFDNGYGASVAKHEGTQGYEDDLFELIVLKFSHEAGDWRVCRSTVITDDALGNLTNTQVMNVLWRLKHM